MPTGNRASTLHVRLCAVSLGAAVLATVGCAPTDETAGSVEGPQGRVSSAIVNGAASASDGVGLIYFSDDTVCSGFLASPNVVITAAFCFNGGRTPIAFYTGPGTAVTSPIGVPSEAGLTMHGVQSYATNPQAHPQASETGAASYTATNDVAYVVLNDPHAGTPLPYGTPASSGTCTALGYGRSGTVYQQGSLGAQLEGTVTISGTLPSSIALNVTGSNLANSGDFGGPLVCQGNVAAVFSAYHYNAQNVIDVNAYQPISGAIKIWIDSIVAANPVHDAPDAGADAATDGASPSSSASSDASTTDPGQPGGELPSTSDDTASPPSQGSSLPSNTPTAGCSMERRSHLGSAAWLLGVVALIGARVRRRR